MEIIPKNWNEFQHYKNRCPPWIKLYRKLLDDSDWHCLPDASKALAIMLWLLASDHELGHIKANNKALAFRLRTTPQKIATALKPLIESGFFIASSTLSECQQVATPETEGERETYKPEIESRFALPDWLDKEKWKAYVKLRPAKARTPESLKAAIEKLDGFRAVGHDPNQIVATSLANGWQGLFEPKVNGSGGNGAGPPWWASNEGIQAKARELGIESRKGESWNDLKTRISESLTTEQVTH